MVRLWTPWSDSRVLLSLYYQWFRPCTILARRLRVFVADVIPIHLRLAHGINSLQKEILR